MKTTAPPPPDQDLPGADHLTRAARSPARRLLNAPELPVAGALLVLVLIFALLRPASFATMDNGRSVVADSSTLVIVAMVTMLVVITANIDLSIGSVIAFCEVVGVKAMVAVGGSGVVTDLIGLAATVGGGLAWGCLNGGLIARLNLPPLIATLATFGIALGAAQVISNGNDLTGVPAGLQDFGIQTFIGVPLIAYVGVLVFALTAFTLRATRFGRHTYAIGSDRQAAERAGIRVRRHVFTVYALAGSAYGLVAFLNLTRFGTTAIGGHTADALNAVTAVALGGTSLFGGVGTALGSLIGVFIPAVLQNGLIIVDVQPYWQQIVVGTALLIAIYVDQRRRARRNRR